MKVGDRVIDIYTSRIGTILNIWDGKYTCSHYEGEQYNPYRITVQWDNSTDGVCGDGTMTSKAEYLETIV